MLWTVVHIYIMPSKSIILCRYQYRQPPPPNPFDILFSRLVYSYVYTNCQLRVPFKALHYMIYLFTYPSPLFITVSLQDQNKARVLPRSQKINYSVSFFFHSSFCVSYRDRDFIFFFLFFLLFQLKWSHIQSAWALVMNTYYSIFIFQFFSFFFSI